MRLRILTTGLLLFTVLVLTALAGNQTQKKNGTKKEPPAPAPAPANKNLDPSAEAKRLNNLGVAYMNQQKMEAALAEFEKALKADPKFLDAKLNSGIAELNLQRLEPAEQTLLEVAKVRPDNIRAWYNLGLIYRGKGQPEKGVEAFSKAAALDPDDADTQYFIGWLYTQLQQYDKAIPAYKRAIELNRFHASAEFGLARALQRAGRADEAKEHLAIFQKMTQEKIAAPMSLIYSEQGKYSLVVSSPQEILPAAPLIPVKFSVVQNAVAYDPKGTPSPTGGACVFDYDQDGSPDVLMVGGVPALYRNVGGKFQNVTKEVGLNVSGPALSCAIADVNADNSPDVAMVVGDHVELWTNLKGKFTNVTKESQITGEGTFLGLSFLDYDHDGDPDLYVLRHGQHAARASNHMWRNNGNGTFTDTTETADLGGASSSVVAVGTDFNNDRAIDLVYTGNFDQPAVRLNPREGKFRYAEAFPSKAPNSSAVAVLDFNKDGWMDLAFTHSQAPALTLWSNVGGKKLEAVALPDMKLTRAWGVAALDFDNDGWVDLVVAGDTTSGSQLHILRNLGPKGFQDVTADVGLDAVKLASARTVIPFDFDGDGTTDLLVSQSSGAPVLLKNVGANKNGWVRIAMKGLNDNKTAIGTKLEIFAGGLWQKFEVNGVGYLGQSAADMVVGLGEHKTVDVVRMLWPSGVIQDEIEAAAGKPHEFLEIDRRGSSCPVLFAWDGDKYRFITDVIGAAVVGHWISPTEKNIADPDEYVKVDGSAVRLKNGLLSFRFGEPMEEVNYLDEVRLLAVDHPSDMEVFTNDRFIGAPPFPKFKIEAVKNMRLPRGAWDDRGNDVLPLLSRVDRKYPQDFTLLKFMGFTKMHKLELDLGDVHDGDPLRLVLHGYIEYFTASSMYSAHQAGLDPIAPYVEAQTADGKWVRVVDEMGFPAGLPRTIVADLTGKLPAGSKRIRIMTNLQIYWDQVLIDQTPDGQQYRVTEVPLAKAVMRFHGYPRQVERHTAPGDLYYIHEDVSPTGPFSVQEGSYTRHGDVTPLLKGVDDKFVVFGTGEEVGADFDPSGLPELPAGWTRDYFFYANGFVKDMDFYAADGQTVAAMPFQEMKSYPYPATEKYPDTPDNVKYLLDWNDRYETGKGIKSYRFHYQGPAGKPGRD